MDDCSSMFGSSTQRLWTMRKNSVSWEYIRRSVCVSECVCVWKLNQIAKEAQWLILNLVEQVT